MLVIVESPNKVRTIQEYLGRDYEVIATKGHFRDLPRTHSGALPEKWETIRGKGTVISELRKAKKRHLDGVILATDPDREGEGIAWHVCDILHLDPAKTPRAVFHEVTREAVQEGIRLARLPDGPTVDIQLVGAQKARRLVDRRIGYSGTRFLWKVVGGGVSAGRCLIPAAKLLKEVNMREDSEGNRIVIRGEIQTAAGVFHLHKILSPEEMPPSAITKEFLFTFLPGVTLDDEYRTSDTIRVEQRSTTHVTKHPPRPLDTAAAISAIGGSPATVMRALQSLFEQGLITYHRTTSRALSSTFRNTVATWATVNGTRLFGEPPGEASGAHEAIRPVKMTPPESIAVDLEAVAKKAYSIIWEHAVGSYFSQWSGERLTVSLEGGWSSSWNRTLSSDGQNRDSTWLAVAGKEPATSFPPETEGLHQDGCVSVFSGWIRATEEPAKKGITENGMVRVLQVAGIGRPSTYATIVGNLSARGLAGFHSRNTTCLAVCRFGESMPDLDETDVDRTRSSFRVTDVGDTCIRMLDKSEFSPFFQIEYTKGLEEELDAIAEGKYEGEWGDFVIRVDTAVTTAEHHHQHTRLPENTGNTNNRGSFPETILGEDDDWIYGKGRTRYGPVIWRENVTDRQNTTPGKRIPRQYRKVRAKDWPKLSLQDAEFTFMRKSNTRTH